MTTKHKYLTVFLPPALNQQPCCNVLLLRNKNFYHEKDNNNRYNRTVHRLRHDIVRNNTPSARAASQARQPQAAETAKEEKA
jgi:hypothetical protein